MNQSDHLDFALTAVWRSAKTNWNVQLAIYDGPREIENETYVHESINTILMIVNAKLLAVEAAYLGLSKPTLLSPSQQTLTSGRSDLEGVD